MHCSSLIHSRADFYFSLLFSLEGSGNKTTAPCGNAWALQRHNKYTVLQLTTYESTSYPVRVGTRLNLHDLVPSPFHVSFSIFSFPIPWITPAPTKVMGIATSFFRLLHVSVRVASGTRPGNYIIMEVLETWVLTSMDGKVLLWNSLKDKKNVYMRNNCNPSNYRPSDQSYTRHITTARTLTLYTQWRNCG